MNNEYFGYVRVSTQKQGEGASLEAQRDAIERYAAQNSLTVTEWYCEKETAAKAGRPVFSAMVRQMKKCHATGFIVHKIDRSARNFKDWAMIGDLSDAGFDIRFATETLEYNSRGGRLAADIQAVIAADFIRNLRDETKKGMLARLREGLYPYGAPLGYLNNGKGAAKTICPTMGPKLKKLFAAYATGTYSLQSLQAHATELGVLTRYGNPLSLGFLGRMLSNPFYCGIIKIRKTDETYPGQHEPLVTVATFDRVQAVKEGRHIKRNTCHQHLYRGLFACAGCSYAMIAERQKGRVYYRCHTPACPRNSMREDAIEADIRAKLNKLHLTEAATKRLTQAIRKWIDDDTKDTGATLSAARQLHQLKEKEQALTDALLSKLVDADTYREQKELIALERRRAEEEAAKSTQTDRSAEAAEEFLELAKNLTGLYETMIPDEKREFLEIATSNRRIEAKSAYFEPRNWLEWAGNGKALLFGDPDRHNPRTPHNRAVDVGKFIAAMQTEEARRFIALCRRAKARNEAKENPPAKADRFKPAA